MTRAGREITVQGPCLESGLGPAVAHAQSASRTDDSFHAFVSGRRTERANGGDTSASRLHTCASPSRYFAGLLDVASDCARSAWAACWPTSVSGPL